MNLKEIEKEVYRRSIGRKGKKEKSDYITV